MTTQTSLFNILKQFNNNGKVIFDNKDFIFLGLDNFSDIIIKGNLKKKLYNKPTLTTYRDNKKIKEETNIKDLIKKIKDLTYEDLITSFNLDAYFIKKIKASINKNNATHIRLYTFNNDLRFTLWDIRTFISQTQLTRQNSIKLFSLPSVQYVEETFTRTLNAESFKMISTNNLEFEITKNHVVVIKDTKNNLTFLLSNQGIKEPVVNFINPKINKSISFLFTKDFSIRNTQV